LEKKKAGQKNLGFLLEKKNAVEEDRYFPES